MKTSSRKRRTEIRVEIFKNLYSHIQEVGMDRNDLAEVIYSEYKDLNIAKCAIRNMRAGKSVIPQRCYGLLNIYLRDVKKHPIPLTYNQFISKFDNICYNGKGRTEHIGIRVSKSDFDTIKEYCEERGISISSFMDNLIQNWKEIK
ncbi:MAG: hypothetical protein ACYS26_22805 [Planctomycetota bacterium]|jgi:hypothetical protein